MCACAGRAQSNPSCHSNSPEGTTSCESVCEEESHSLQSYLDGASTEGARPAPRQFYSLASLFHVWRDGQLFTRKDTRTMATNKRTNNPNQPTLGSASFFQFKMTKSMSVSTRCNCQECKTKRLNCFLRVLSQQTQTTPAKGTAQSSQPNKKQQQAQRRAITCTSTHCSRAEPLSSGRCLAAAICL